MVVRAVLLSVLIRKDKADFGGVGKVSAEVLAEPVGQFVLAQLSRGVEQRETKT